MFRQKILLMKARNTFVSAGLREAYRKNLPDGELRIECVSSELYQKYMSTVHHGCVQASGVPDLRRRCHEITAEAQYREAKNFLVAKLPGLLNSVRIWVGRAEERSLVVHSSHDQLEESLDRLDRATERAIERWKTGAQNAFDEFIMPRMTDRSSAWVKAARRKSEFWESWHWAQYDAWCRNDGTYETPKQPFRAWNDEIITHMRGELAPGWATLMSSAIPDTFTQLDTLLANALGDLRTMAIDSDGTLTASIDLHQAQLRYELDIEKRTVAENLHTLHQHASEDRASSFVLRCMLSAYRTAAADKGPGKAARQRNTINGRINSEELFPTMVTLIVRSMVELVGHAHERIDATVWKAMNLIRADFEMAMAGLPPEQTAESVGARSTIRERIDAWDATLQGILDVALRKEQ